MVFFAISCTAKKTKPFRTNPNLKTHSGLFGTSPKGQLFKLQNDTKTYRLDTTNALSFNYLESVNKNISNTIGHPTLTLTFNKVGTQKLTKLTTTHQKHPLLFVVNNQLLLAPIVQEKITGGRLQINGGFSMEEIDIIYKQLVADEE